MAEPKNERLVWIDCEMTGLDPARDELVEVAAIVTDANLVELDPGISLVIRPTDMTLLERMDPVVTNMHTASGLLDEIPSGVTLREASDQLLTYLKSHVPEPRRAPLAGSSVYVDRGFLARHLPEVEGHLHYRLIDVSAIKELARRWYPRAYFNSPEKVGNHRALADIRESIAELRYYRATVFVPEPGPSTEQAREAAAVNTVANHQDASLG